MTTLSNAKMPSLKDKIEKEEAKSIVEENQKVEIKIKKVKKNNE